MPKGRSRRRGRRGRRPPVPAAGVQAARPVAKPVAVAAPSEREPARQRSATRFSTRDYAYVRRDIQRVVVLATAILITIVVLSFFLP